MAKKMQLETISREFVKPFTSKAIDHPKFHILSFFDQIFPCFYTPLLFFYEGDSGENDHHKHSSVLKISLSAILSHYYPLAGRVRDNATLDCNDEGVLFIEKVIEHDLSETLNDPDDETLKLLLPDNLYCNDSFVIGPVAIQVTYFQCGGMSVGLCMCHKVLDMDSKSSFISEWASLAQNNNQVMNPEFNMGSLYPPLDIPLLNRKQQLRPDMKDIKIVSNRLVFDGSYIAKLKARVAHEVSNPTRVEVVSALLCKSAICAASRANSSGRLKSSVVNHAINLRKHVYPLLSNINKGNMSLTFQVSVQEDTDVELARYVKQFRQSKSRLCHDCGSVNNREELCSLILKNMKQISDYYNADHEVYICTSWCRFPFYDVDFGWGKPLWVSTDWKNVKNLIILVDTKDGNGIEAYICLEEKVMAALEYDEDLSFRVSNHSLV